MKTERNILIAFLLNLSFSIIEFIGGFLIGSIAIISDSVHDLGDAISIGLSYFLEKKSKKQPDNTHTYGYIRYSVLGGVLTTIILITGSLFVIYTSIKRIFNPVKIHYDQMIGLAIFGVILNFIAAYVTREGDSINQKAVNLHMLEDVLGWVIVLIGAIIMKFTDISIIDPIMSICVALFILYNSTKNLQEVLDIFLEKTPKNISIDELKEHISEIDGIIDVHHIHLWSIDGQNTYGTMHIVLDDNCDNHTIKHQVREELKEHGIVHATLELETKDEVCDEIDCHTNFKNSNEHHHHHHH